MPTLRKTAKELHREAFDKLQRFKDYVHKRLDEAGIPTHPEGEHSKHGCRIGDRLDIALNARPADTGDCGEAVDAYIAKRYPHGLPLGLTKWMLEEAFQAAYSARPADTGDCGEAQEVTRPDTEKGELEPILYRGEETGVYVTKGIAANSKLLKALEPFAQAIRALESGKEASDGRKS